MKFFTPELLERFGSEEDCVSLAAQEELEQRSETYLRRLHEIEPKLPQRFRALLEQAYLHDARVITSDSLGLPDISSFVQTLAGFPAGAAPLVKKRHLLSFWIPLQLDTPPRNLLVLQYRNVRIEDALLHKELSPEECPYLEWQYDEVDLIETDQRTEFLHSILFTNGLELQLRFRDFDFAPLKPMEIPREPMGLR